MTSASSLSALGWLLYIWIGWSSQTPSSSAEGIASLPWFLVVVLRNLGVKTWVKRRHYRYHSLFCLLCQYIFCPAEQLAYTALTLAFAVKVFMKNFSCCLSSHTRFNSRWAWAFLIPFPYAQTVSLYSSEVVCPCSFLQWTYFFVWAEHSSMLTFGSVYLMFCILEWTVLWEGCPWRSMSFPGCLQPSRQFLIETCKADPWTAQNLLLSLPGL